MHGKNAFRSKNRVASTGRIDNAGDELQPQRTNWDNFPNVELIEPAKTIATHPAYYLAKQGDLQAALTLVNDVLDVDGLLRLKARFEQYKPDYIQPIHAEEQLGRNKLPVAFGLLLSHNLDVPLGRDIVQSSRAYRTGADGYHRLIERVGFDGVVQQGARYFIVDDAITQGGTLADMRSYIIQQGGWVVGASTLMGKPHSATIAITKPTLGLLRKAAGKDLEQWWHEQFGYDFSKFTESEARYLTKQINREGVESVRNHLTEARFASGSR
ncbi:MAG: hypothetical protein RLY58_1754 [Pseudomonadota bacterium]